jgi:hypothetical protein
MGLRDRLRRLWGGWRGSGDANPAGDDPSLPIEKNGVSKQKDCELFVVECVYVMGDVVVFGVTRKLILANFSKFFG